MQPPLQAPHSDPPAAATLAKREASKPDALLDPDSPSSRQAARRLSRASLPLLGLVVVSFLGLGSALQGLNLESGLWLTQALVFVLPAWLFFRASNLRPLPSLGLGQRLSPGNALVVLFVALSNYPVAAGLMGLCRLWLPEALRTPDVARILDQSSSLSLALILGAVSIAAPLGEEIFFRGTLFQLHAAGRGALRGLVVSAVAFSLLHLDPIGFLPRVELGLLFGWLFWRTGSLWAAILAHAVNNTAAALLFYLGGAEAEVETMATLGQLSTSIALGLLVLVPLLLYVQRNSRPQTAPFQAYEATRPIGFDRDSGGALGLLLLLLASLLSLLFVGGALLLAGR